MPALTQTKPTKPYPSFPLTAHPNGQWCKKIRGRLHFFGVWAEPREALDRYHAAAADLHQGRQPRPIKVAGNALTVKEVCNAFLGWQKDKAESGEIGSRWFEDCHIILKDFAKAVGTSRLIEDLRPDDFQKYRAGLAKRVGVHALTRYITVVKSAFKHAYETDRLDRPMKFGNGFAKPTASQKRKAKLELEVEHGKRLLTAKELRTIIKSCEPRLLAPILLGLNGGFGNTDCARLPRSAVDLKKAVIEYHRPKTGIQRTVPLWPETVDALRSVMQAPESNTLDPALARLVFVSPRGKPLIRQNKPKKEEDEELKHSHTDGLSSAFATLLRTLDLHRQGIGFYTLRHTFRTLADEVRDQHAIHRIMGHSLPGMSGVYVEEISLDRLRAVVDHVHRKVFSLQ